MRHLGSLAIIGLAFCVGLAADETMAAERKPANAIKVLEATYGGNCEGVAKGNVTQFVGSKCNDTNLCNYRVYHKSMGGDPAAGCEKDFAVTYSCGRKSKPESCKLPAEAGMGGEEGHPNQFCLLHCLGTADQSGSASRAQANGPPPARSQAHAIPTPDSRGRFPTYQGFFPPFTTGSRW
jgi:hypothetical protein